MLTRLRFKNFKAWKDTGDVRLAPLTVFFGPNSSGKTSLLQFLLLLKQTAQSPDRFRVLHMGDRETPIDLGTYSDMVYGHDAELPLDFELAWDLPQTLEVKDAETGIKRSGLSLSFEAVVGLVQTGDGTPAVRKLKYCLGDPKNGGLAVGMAESDRHKDTFDPYSENFPLRGTQGRPPHLRKPVHFYGFPDEIRATYKNADFVGDLALAFEDRLQRLDYLGPLRQFPERSYMWSGETPEHVGWRGERAVYALLAAAGRHISRGKRKKKELFEALVARWLKNLGLIAGFDVKQVAPKSRHYEVMVQTTAKAQAVNLKDVGFGVSQVLPVVVQCFYSPPDSAVIMEQPEIHLHPSVQANMADLFVEAVQSWEDGAARRTQLIVESHSEHFLRRLQRRIAENRITRDETALYFVRTKGASAVLEPLDVDEFGNIRNWPEDFFGDEMKDLVARTEAQAGRMMAGGSK